ncbi:hypothetical protein AB837_00629 [bacterium AB1]|nr:hypothetical protein AB837_00629 [bacterium AB1]
MVQNKIHLILSLNELFKSYKDISQMSNLVQEKFDLLNEYTNIVFEDYKKHVLEANQGLLPDQQSEEMLNVILIETFQNELNNMHSFFSGRLDIITQEVQCLSSFLDQNTFDVDSIKNHTYNYLKQYFKKTKSKLQKLEKSKILSLKTLEYTYISLFESDKFNQSWNNLFMNVNQELRILTELYDTITTNIFDTYISIYLEEFETSSLEYSVTMKYIIKPILYLLYGGTMVFIIQFPSQYLYFCLQLLNFAYSMPNYFLNFFN